MAGTKISALPAVTAPLSTDVVPIVNSGATKKVTVANLVAASSVSAAARLLGRGDSGAGVLEEITVGSGLAMTGTTLSARRVSPIFEYAFATTTTAPPGTNQIRFNAASPYTAVTKVWVATLTSDGEDVYHGLRLLPVGARILVQDKNDHTQYAVFSLTAPPIDNTSYFELPVSHLEHGSALNGGQPVLFQAMGTAVVGSVLVDTGNSGASKTIDWSSGNVQYSTLTGNCAFTFTNPISGFRYALIINPGGGGFTPTFSPTLAWLDAVPTLPTVAGKLYEVVLQYIGPASKYLAAFTKEA